MPKLTNNSWVDSFMGAGRRSKWEHLKDQIMQHCKEGKTPVQLYPMYPDVPRATIHDWYKLSQKQDKQNKQELHNDNVKPFVVLEGGKKDISDFALAREVFRSIADNPQKYSERIQIQAALGLIKLIKLRNDVAPDILDEITASSLKIEEEKLKGLSPEILAKMYKEIIG